MSNRKVFVISSVLPRWVSDFNAVTTRLSEDGFDVTLYVPAAEPLAQRGVRNRQDIEAARTRLHPAVTVQELPYSYNGFGPVALLRTIALTASLASRHRSAIFILWTIVSIVVFGPFLRLAGCRVLYMVTGLGMVFADSGRARRLRPLVEWIYGRLFRTPQARIVVHNHEDRAFLSERFGLPPSRIYVTGGCGIDPAAFPFDERPQGYTPVILVPVRLLVPKGVRDAAAASALLARRGIQHEMHFTSSGDAAHPDSLAAEEIADIRSTTPSVRFIGYQDDIAACYRRSDIVCMPSYYPEGLPTVLLEAASTGRPIVACDNVGTREFIRDGIDGLLVPPRSPEALADALERLIRDPQLARRLRDSAHHRFLSGYTKQAMLEQTLAAMAALGQPDAIGPATISAA